MSKKEKQPSSQATDSIRTLLNEMVKRGDETVSKVVGELMMNETFASAVETAVSTKSIVDRKVRAVLNTMNFATRLDVEEMDQQIRRLARDLKKLERAFTRLEKKIGS